MLRSGQRRLQRNYEPVASYVRQQTDAKYGALPGCMKKGPAEKVGESLDNAAESAGDHIENAGEAIQDAAHDATH
jgi:hypothetical protein